jgi:uncharacterized protein YndB with AHSA1/START domain
MLKKILIASAVVIVVLVIVVLLQPSQFQVTRSATIAAPPEAVFAQVDDFHRWEAWSPWAKLDPAAKNSFEGPAAGTGAVFRWAGNSEVGAGSMTITESQPGKLVRMRLDFLQPMAATNTADFTFAPAGSGTTVTWSMYGTNNFMCRAIGLVMNMDKMVGGMFEQGLANMKGIVEAGQAK